MKHIKLFENFSRDYLKQNNNSLTAFYSGKLSSFNLEAKVLDLLAEFESQVDSTFSDKWDLNRGRNYGRYNGDYFSLNVKVYKWPNPDNIKKKFGIKMDDERLSDIWYQWLSQEAEFFEEDLKEQYSWIDNISWGGNSGGWLHIYPENGADSLLEAAEEEIQMYLDIKEFYDEVELEEVGKAINNPEWERLAELGLVEDAEEIRKIVEGLTSIINWLKTEINNLINKKTFVIGFENAKSSFIDFVNVIKSHGGIASSAIAAFSENTFNVITNISKGIDANETLNPSFSSAPAVSLQSSAKDPVKIIVPSGPCLISLTFPNSSPISISDKSSPTFLLNLK